MADFTSGPWHAGEGRMAIIVFDQRGYAVADAKNYHGAQGPGEAEANARLLAAAPELLAALQFIVSEEHPPFGSKRAERVETARRMALEAIAKATGK